VKNRQVKNFSTLRAAQPLYMAAPLLGTFQHPCSQGGIVFALYLMLYAWGIILVHMLSVQKTVTVRVTQFTAHINKPLSKRNLQGFFYVSTHASFTTTVCIYVPLWSAL